MTKETSEKRFRFIKGVGIGSFVLGIIFVIAGIGTWTLVSTTLQEQNITIPGDANYFPGKEVKGPFTAYAQADVIEMHALEGSNGLTYSELGGKVKEAQEAGDEDAAAEFQAQRNSVMNGSFLQASLFTSVLAFGVSAMVIGLGVLLAFIGVVIRQMAIGFQPKELARA